MDQFREVLSREGYEIHSHCGRRWYGRAPERELATLTHQTPAAVWVLFVATPEIQRWFELSKLGCVASGSVHPGIRIPSVDLDHRATCRHAAGRLLASGHRALVFLREGTPIAGDRESERGFLEGAALVPGTETIVAQHDGSPNGIRRAVSALLRRPVVPTGFLVARANAVLSVASELIRLGVQIPEQASVICRDSDRFLEYFSPRIARYEAAPLTHAQRLANLVLRVAREGSGLAPQVRLMPRFYSNESLGLPQSAPEGQAAFRVEKSSLSPDESRQTTAARTDSQSIA